MKRAVFSKVLYQAFQEGPGPASPLSPQSHLLAPHPLALVTSTALLSPNVLHTWSLCQCCPCNWGCSFSDIQGWLSTSFKSLFKISLAQKALLNHSLYTTSLKTFFPSYSASLSFIHLPHWIRCTCICICVCLIAQRCNIHYVNTTI